MQLLHRNCTSKKVWLVKIRKINQSVLKIFFYPKCLEIFKRQNFIQKSFDDFVTTAHTYLFKKRGKDVMLFSNKKHGVILITFHLPTSCLVCCPHIRKKNEGVVAVGAVAVVVAAANAVHRLETNLEQNFVSNVVRKKLSTRSWYELTKSKRLMN